MSVATLPPQHAAGGWKTTTVPCTVEIIPRPGYVFANNVTLGPPDIETPNNTATNTRASNDADTKGFGEGDGITTVIDLLNIDRYLRSLKPGSNIDETIVSNITKLVEEGKSFKSEVSTYEFPRIKQYRKSQSDGLQNIARSIGQEGVTKWKQAKLLIGKKWLKGETDELFSKKLDTELNFKNLHNLFTRDTSLVNDETIRKSVQRILLGDTDPQTVQLSFDDRESMLDGVDNIACEEIVDKARGEDWKKKRHEQLTELATDWYLKAGMTKATWDKSMIETKGEMEASEYLATAGTTKTILSEYNLDLFLERAVKDATNPTLRAVALEADRGGKVHIDVRSEKLATELTQCALQTMKIRQDLETSKDQDGFTKWNDSRQDRIAKFITRWETDSGVKEEDWGKPSSGGPGTSSAASGGSTNSRISTKPQTSTSKSST